MFHAQIPLAFVVLKFSDAGDSTVLGFNYRCCLTVQLFGPALFAIMILVWPFLDCLPGFVGCYTLACGLTNRDFPRQIVKI
ncbi:hypothetical protein C8J56DRAFT_1032170 [Mycena floridula]|nr:hypothetical protein C8J56DRAFT_1032170 [Mycena floridula]